MNNANYNMMSFLQVNALKNGGESVTMVVKHLKAGEEFFLAGTRRCSNVLFWSKKCRDVDNVISTSYIHCFTNVVPTMINYVAST